MILSHVNCFIQGQVVGFQVQYWIDLIHIVREREHPGGLPQFSEGKLLNLLGICFVWHSYNVAEQGETLCFDNSRQVWLPSCPSHVIIPHMVDFWFHGGTCTI